MHSYLLKRRGPITRVRFTTSAGTFGAITFRGHISGQAIRAAIMVLSEGTVSPCHAQMNLPLTEAELQQKRHRFA